MTSRPMVDRQLGSSRSLPAGHTNRHVNGNDVNRPASSLPMSTSASFRSSYDIPSLRSRIEPQSVDANADRTDRSTGYSLPSLINRTKDQNHGQAQIKESGAAKHNTYARDRFTQLRARVSGSRVNLSAEPKLATGNCMTCASTVRWPQDIKAFRCTTCLTVNDLEYLQEDDGQGRTILNRKPISISLDRTRQLIGRCIDHHLRQQSQFASNKQGAVRKREDHETREFNESLFSPTPAFVKPPSSLADASDSHTILNGNSRLTERSRRANSSEANVDDHQRHLSATSGHQHPKKDETVSIFREVEVYISSCFSGCATLNASFYSGPITTNITKKTNRPIESTTQRDLPKEDESTFQPDAKLLLLGEVAENGSWWTGRTASKEGRSRLGRDHSPEHRHGVVSAKTPRIDWQEVDDWYQAIIHAGDGWQTGHAAIETRDEDQPGQTTDLNRYDQIGVDLHESQLRLQRILLKATENLLKRPRQPLNNPEDCRFLLILLANPLITSPKQSVRVPKIFNRRPNQREHQDINLKVMTDTRRDRNLGHHAGIVKRILGILSNLSNEEHQFLVSWMSKFSDRHFQTLVDVVSSFVTYRLSKHQDRNIVEAIDPTEGLVPTLSDTGESRASQFHAVIGSQSPAKARKKTEGRPRLGMYSDDWQVKAAARFMSLLFQANTGHTVRRRHAAVTSQQQLHSAGLNAKYHANSHGQILPISAFYNTMLDHADLVGDFEAWETTKTRFTFCQYPFFLSIWAKIHIMEHDARRQMEVKAREAFFDSILSRRAISQYLVLKVRRDCLVDDSLRSVSQVVGSGGSDIKKGLRIDFVGEEGVDAGGLRKEWFLLLVREIFDPQHGLFLYDDESRYCYFNPFCFESSEQFFLVGVLLGLAIYNSTILDVAFPPFVFKKMLASAPPTGDKLTSTSKLSNTYTLEDLAEYQPVLAKGLRQLLDYEGDVQETFCRDFVIEMDKYGETIQVPLRSNGANIPVTNANRREFVDLYVRYLLDTAVARQYEPFKRGFFSVCGGNALSLFQPEEIELLVRGSEEPLDVASLRAVATYMNWPKTAGPPEQHPPVIWFWQTFEQAGPSDQRRLLGFITGSDRIPAMGATNLTIRVSCLRDAEAEDEGRETHRFPTARTCFNTINLYQYFSRETLEHKLWTAVRESEGFGLK